MKKLLVLLAATISGLQAMQNPAYITAKVTINTLQEKADTGDAASAIAVYDFYENVKNPNYVISFSKEILQDYGLLDEYGKVQKAIRETFLAAEAQRPRF